MKNAEAKILEISSKSENDLGVKLGSVGKLILI